MTSTIILNLVLAVLVVGAIVSLLGWSVASDAGRVRRGPRSPAPRRKTQAAPGSARRRPDRASALGSM